MEASGRCSALSGSVFRRCRDLEGARPAKLPRHRLADWECWGRQSWLRWSRLWNCRQGRHRCAAMIRNSSAHRSCRSCGSGPTPCRWKPAAPSRPVLLRIFSWTLLLLRRRCCAVNADGELQVPGAALVAWPLVTRREGRRQHAVTGANAVAREPRIYGLKYWSGRRESNPRMQLGKLPFYH